MLDIKLCEEKECTGCMACQQICPCGAVEKVQVNGFIYPEVNDNVCVGCGQCMKTCPVLNISENKGNTHIDESVCYAVYSKDDSLRMKSSSGGFFSVIAEKVLADDGVVYGAAWDESMNLIHRGIANRENLETIRRSKYVQSDTAQTFKEVQRYLKEGRKVLYCGTPCQLAGLHSFLKGINHKNLVLVDVLCQGVPSPWGFKKYIKEIEADSGLEVVDCNFRTKKYGWRCGLLLLLLLNDERKNKQKKKKLTNENNSYYRAFVRDYFMRPSCYNCQFKNNHQGYYSDITIADFWRIGTQIPLNVDNYEKGISAVMLNNEKGRDFFYQCKDDLKIIERTWQEFSTNGGLYSSHKPNNNDEAFRYLQNHTWKETQAKYFPVTFKERLRVNLHILLGGQNIRNIKKLIRG